MLNFGNNTFIRSASPQFSDEDISEQSPIHQPPPVMTRNNYQPPAVDYYQQKPTGRNTFAFWVLILLLFVLTLGNLALTMTIIGVLRFGRGMEFMELVPEAETIKFYGDVDLDRIQKRDGIIEGFSDIPMSIEGDAGPVLFNLVYRNGHTHNKFYMSKNGTHFRGIREFEIRNPVTRQPIFSTNRPRYNIPSGVKNLRAGSISASRITSPIQENLQIQTKGKLLLSGAEGITMDSQEMLWSADQNISLKSINGSIVLVSGEGTYLDIQRIPIVQIEHGLRAGPMQYKLCVCMPEGKLFRVPVPRSHSGKVSCVHFSANFDPCN